MSSTRVLYISGSVGLGHARRDLAIARELRRLNPGVDIVWLAGEPARHLIAEAGETLLPESAAYGNETGVAEDASEGFSLNLLGRFALRVQGAWKRAVATFEEVSARYPYDLLIGDETYEIDAALGKQPELKKAPFVMIYDFVGLDAMSRNPLERLMVYRGNWVWGGGPRGKPPTQEDLTLFIGELEDVADKRFGFLLPNRREYARRFYHFVGYAFPFDPADYADKEKVRSALGYDERPLVVCAVGGTAIGDELLRLCAASYPHIQERVGDVRMMLVCGPRIDPAAVRAPSGVEVRGYVPRLYEHFAACDVAIVQGGGTTTLELTALRRPFVYFPLEGHFEQNLVVAERLARHGAGQRLLYSKTTPERLAEAVTGQLGREASWPPIPTDGARRAAELIHDLVGARASAQSAG